MVLLAILHLRVAESVADGERYAVDRNLDFIMAGEVLATAATLNHDAATVESQRLACAEGHGVVQLEDVANGLVLILRVTVGKVDVVGRVVEVVGHLGGGGAVVQLIGKGQRLGALFVEETLVVDAAAERRARVLHLGVAAVAVWGER